MSIEYSYPSQNQRLELLCGPCQNPGEKPLISNDALSFKDVLDTINPLQQLPVVGTVYRSVTGDTISTISRLVGGAILGGPIGFMVAALSAGFEAATGGDIGEHMLAMASGDEAEHEYAQNAYAKANNLPG
jgi:hypothetical protein